MSMDSTVIWSSVYGPIWTCIWALYNDTRLRQSFELSDTHCRQRTVLSCRLKYNKVMKWHFLHLRRQRTRTVVTKDILFYLLSSFILFSYSAFPAKFALTSRCNLRVKSLRKSKWFAACRFPKARLTCDAVWRTAFRQLRAP